MHSCLELQATAITGRTNRAHVHVSSTQWPCNKPQTRQLFTGQDENAPETDGDGDDGVVVVVVVAADVHLVNQDNQFLALEADGWAGVYLGKAMVVSVSNRLGELAWKAVLGVGSHRSAVDVGGTVFGPIKASNAKCVPHCPCPAKGIAAISLTLLVASHPPSAFRIAPCCFLAFALVDAFLLIIRTPPTIRLATSSNLPAVPLLCLLVVLPNPTHSLHHLRHSYSPVLHYATRT